MNERLWRKRNGGLGVGMKTIVGMTRVKSWGLEECMVEYWIKESSLFSEMTMILTN